MKFRMVDQIIDYTPHERISGVKAVSFEEYQMRCAIDAQPRLPESLVLQSLVELGNWLIVLSSEFSQSGVLVSLERAEFHAPVGPGDRLMIDVACASRDECAVELTGRARTSLGEVVAIDRWQARLHPLSRFYCPDDLRTLFAEIHRPLAGGIR